MVGYRVRPSTVNVFPTFAEIVTSTVILLDALDNRWQAASKGHREYRVTPLKGAPPKIQPC